MELTFFVFLIISVGFISMFGIMEKSYQAQAQAVFYQAQATAAPTNTPQPTPLPSPTPQPSPTPTPDTQNQNTKSSGPSTIIIFFTIFIIGSLLAVFLSTRRIGRSR